MVANYYCKHYTAYKADGYTKPYQYAGIFSNIFWVVIALFVLRAFLKRFFTDNIVFATLLCTAFATNLYAYTSFELGMSHPYSFFLFSCLLNATDLAYRKRQNKENTLGYNILVGVITGFIFIVRPINIISCLVPLFFGVDSIVGLFAKIKFYLKNIAAILVPIALFCIIAFLQLSYWKYITGHWLFYSYTGEKFNFSHPNIINGLFSYRKGWFVYTPVAFLGILGLGRLWKEQKQLLFSTLSFYLVFIYCIFSWQEWWYGGGFGCRPLIESLALLSVPLACIIKYFLQKQNRAVRIGFSTLLAIFIFLNIFQTYQYSKCLIHWSRMTKEYYWRVFGTLDFDRNANEQYLIKEADEYKFD